MKSAGRGQHHHEDHADVGQPPNRRSGMRSAAPGRRAHQETHPQRDEHQHNSDRAIFTGFTVIPSRKTASEGQVCQVTTISSTIKPTAKARSALANSASLIRTARRRQPAQQQADPQPLVEDRAPARARALPAAPRRSSPRGQHDQPGVLERGQDLADGQTQANASVLDTTKTTTATLEPRSAGRSAPPSPPFVTSLRRGQSASTPRSPDRATLLTSAPPNPTISTSGRSNLLLKPLPGSRAELLCQPKSSPVINAQASGIGGVSVAVSLAQMSGCRRSIPGDVETNPFGFASAGSRRPHGVAVGTSFVVAKVVQRLRRLSVPPNRVVKCVESMSTMSAARGRRAASGVRRR